MEQKENSEIIVIKSDKEWIQEIKADTTSHVIGSVGIIAGISFGLLYPSSVPKWEIELLSSPLIIVTILFILDIYRIWRNIGRELVLDKTGILIKLWFKEKKYGWNDFKFRQVRKNIGEYCYDEGLFLTKHKHQPRQNSNCELFSIRYPSGSVVINFKMHRPILANQKTQQYINAEIMAVEKEELLSKLKEWGVDFETERPKKLGYFSGQKGKITVQKKWNRLDLTRGCCLDFTFRFYHISNLYLEESSTDCYLYSIFYSSCSSLCGSHQQKKLPFKDG